MKEKIRKYLDILKIELEDLIDDLEFSETILSKRLKEHEITEYVFLENISLLKKEILGIEKVKQIILGSGKTYNSLEELREAVENHFHDELKSAGLPNVVFLLVNRKLEKVSKYMALDD